MMKRKKILSLLSLLTTFMMIFSSVSCTDTETTDSTKFALYYMGVTDIGPSMNYNSGTPTYIGPTPSNFKITEVSLDGTPIETDCFTVDSSTGVLSISNTTDLNVGTYQFGISCIAGGKEYNFPAAITVNMLPAVPEGVKCEPSEITLEYSEVKTSDASAQVTTDGNHVSITAYSIIQEKGKEYFQISKTGTITVNSSYKGEIPPGIYPVSLKLTTGAGNCIFENAVTFNITSKPLELTYTPNQGTIEVGNKFETTEPELIASLEGLKYSINKITPATDQITIDQNTGVISVPENNTLNIGDKFDIDIEVSNSFGTNIFTNAYTLNVVAFIKPISGFAYEAANVVEATAFSASPSEDMTGDQVTYSLVDNLNGQLTIDKQTGKVSAAKGNSIPVGTHKVSVKAKNVKGEATAELTIVVTENINKFTYIRYGNNLGLAPIESYANQYRVTSSAEMTELSLTPTTDIKTGAEVTWSVSSKLNMGNTTIDENSGKITLSANDWKSATCGLIIVKATTGKGTATEVSVSVPVFFNFSAPVSGVNILYKPFVVQVNPKNGGTFNTPELTGVTDASKFIMDYRRTFNYFNFNGPNTHKDGQPSVSGSFMNQVWKKYFESIGSATVNTGTRQPMSYYDNNGVNGLTLAQALAYIEASSLAVHVNPNKFIGEDGEPANGALIGQITFVTDGNSANVGNGQKIFPVIIWFDTNF